jgi:hypothetical protein
VNYPLYPADPNRDPAEPFRNLDPAPATGSLTTVATRPDAWDDVVDSRPRTAEELIERQREQFGGVKVGSAFFGWLIAMGTAAILTGLLAATGAALGLGVALNPAAPAGAAPLDAETVRWIVAGALLVILLVGFYCGGYVAGRMARFNGVRQGFAVWAWAIVIAIVAAGISVALGYQDEILDGLLNAFRLLPVSEGVLTIAGVVTVVAAAVVSLGGAILGGVVGVRYHRRVDGAGLDR